jgi:hypothetical protein
MSDEHPGHFEVVRILESPATRHLGIAGLIGIILGVSAEEAEGIPLNYAVKVDSLGQSFMVSGDDLVAIGQQVPAVDIYDGTSIRVTEKGEVIEPRD